MSAKECLKKLQYMDRKINLDIKQRDHLRCLASKLSSGGYEEHYNPNQPQEAPYEHSIQKLIDLEKIITKEIDEYVDYKTKITALLRKMDDFDEREVLEMRYLNNMDWDNIARERGTSLRWTYYVHRNALDSFEIILGREPVAV